MNLSLNAKELIFFIFFYDTIKTKKLKKNKYLVNNSLIEMSNMFFVPTHQLCWNKTIKICNLILNRTLNILLYFKKISWIKSAFFQRLQFIFEEQHSNACLMTILGGANNFISKFDIIYNYHLSLSCCLRPSL